MSQRKRTRIGKRSDGSSDTLTGASAPIASPGGEKMSSKDTQAQADVGIRVLEMLESLDRRLLALENRAPAQTDTEAHALAMLEALEARTEVLKAHAPSGTYTKAQAQEVIKEVAAEVVANADAPAREVDTVKFPRYHQCKRARKRGQAHDEAPLGTWYVEHPERPITRMLKRELVYSTGKLKKALEVEFPLPRAPKPKRMSGRMPRRIAEHDAIDEKLGTRGCTCTPTHDCKAVASGQRENPYRNQ